MLQITVTQFVLGIAVATAAALLVFRDAERRHDRHATAWGVGSFLAPGVAVVLYLVHVSRGRRRNAGDRT
jgi:hypothetical protein